MPRMIQDFVKRMSNRSAKATPRFISRSWLLVLIPSCITLTAYGVAEFGPKEEIKLNTQTESIATPSLLFAQSNSPIWHEDVIRAGDSVSAVLNRLNVDDKEASQFIKTDPIAKALFELHAGRSLRAKTERSGALLELYYLNNKNQEIKITRQSNGFKASIDEATTQQHTVVKSGTINSS
ncbi:MAG: hypothetical protein K2Q15_04360, partial [Burkholderiales bacterium]|nr:hypothetical protein [Burkholderiales bacterium]